MKYEVEQKFQLADPAVIEARLPALGVVAGKPVEQHDTYFAHPARDFGHTDEALRIRSVGSRRSITYKGPRIDTSTKTRREIELALPPTPADGDADDFPQLLGALGFVRVLDVHKTRRTCRLTRQGYSFEIALDEVRGLGQFIELETMADEEHVDSARSALNSLAAELALEQPERRSYLELLLEATI